MNLRALLARLFIMELLISRLGRISLKQKNHEQQHGHDEAKFN